MSFRRYIAGVLTDGLPEGHFVVDARQDEQLPDAETWDDLKTYIRDKGGTAATIKCAATFWKAYERTREPR
jgi:hypothetical protein